MPKAGWTPGVDQTPKCSSAMDTTHVVMPTEGRVTRSQSRVREKYAPFASKAVTSEIKELRNSSHASVSLLTPRQKSSSSQSQQQQENLPFKGPSAFVPRRTSLLAMEQARGSSPMDIDLASPKSPKVLTSKQFSHGAYKHWKESEVTNGQRGPSRRSSVSSATCLKPNSGTETMSALKTAFVGGMRARQVHDDMESGGGDERSGSRIMVYVRFRPMSKKEKEAGARSCVKVDNNRDVYLTEMALETDYLRLKRLRGRHFTFDAAFTENATQQEIYDASTANLVQEVLDGKNASVFCYGATGAGKTHTMLGTVQHPGVMVLALKDLFTKLKLRSQDDGRIVRLSYLEVYNESVRDLLSPGRPLVLREDSKLGIVAAGLTQFQASSADEIMTLLHKGNKNRQTEPTRANETSSRSHAILQVVVEYKVLLESGRFLRVGKLSLIDLAGSERALATDTRTLRSVEGANINRSLLALSSCINALVEGKKHIPFRNSKLTQLLKDSLGGECHTAMIANLSPSNGSFGETQNTLHWADRAKEIRTKECEAHEGHQVPELQDDQAKLLLKMQKENQQLKLHLARLEQKYLTSNGLNDARPSQPLTPLPPIAALAVVSYPGERLNHVDTLARRGETRTMADKKIWELQRTVELLEMEAEKIRRDSAVREEKMNASILALTRDHTVQLKHKDDVIRNLSQSVHCETPRPPVPDVVSSPVKCLEKILKQRPTFCLENGGTPEKLRRYVTPAVANRPCPLPRTGSRSALPKPAQKTSPRPARMLTRSQTPTSPAKTPTKSVQLPKRFSPSKADDLASCRKRTFWDITNSPNSHMGRTVQASSVGGKSQLRQPGFARRRTSPEQY